MGPSSGGGGEDKTLVSPPATTAPPLQLALLGARGSTASQLVAALHLGAPGRPAEAAEDGLRLLSGVIQAPSQAPDGDTTLRAPNTLWLQAGLPLEPSFSRQVRDGAAA